MFRIFSWFVSEVASAAMGVAVVDVIKSVLKKNAHSAEGETSGGKSPDFKKVLGEATTAAQKSLSEGSAILDERATEGLRGVNRWLKGRWWVR